MGGVSSSTSAVRRSSRRSGSSQPELVEEHGRQLRVPVLAGVHDDLVDPCLAQRERERRRLDELRPVPDDGEKPHRGERIRDDFLDDLDEGV